MATKPTKIVDIQAPKDVAAEASGRPLVVTNRPVLTDPMMKPEAAGSADAPAVPLARTGKTIKPLEPATPAEDATQAEEPAAMPAANSSTAEPAKPAAPSESETPPSSTDAVAVDLSESKTDGPDLTRDAEAEVAAAETKAEEARLAREVELEGLVASGKYFVPINAAARKRTRTYVVVLLVCTLLAAVALLDLALDMGLLKTSLPHTNFFK